VFGSGESQARRVVGDGEKAAAGTVDWHFLAIQHHYDDAKGGWAILGLRGPRVVTTIVVWR
jgi:hypothetical protein